MSTEKQPIAVLISGGGSNLQSLIDACEQGDFPARIAVVISNKPDAYGLTRAKDAGIPALVVNHKDYATREEFDKALLEALKPYAPKLICLAGFMRILTPTFIKNWPHRILNTHPALLPAHGGKGMYGMHVHKAVLEAGDTESGASIHYVIPEVDQGPVLLQSAVPVLQNDTPDTLAQRVLEQEHKLYPEAVRIAVNQLLNA